MPRDWELLRYLLMKLIGNAPDLDRDWSEEQKMYHRYLLVDGGLAHGAVIESNDSRWPDALLANPTWKGYDFLSWASDDIKWKVVRALIKHHSLPDTLDMMNMIIEQRHRGPNI